MEWTVQRIFFRYDYSLDCIFKKWQCIKVWKIYRTDEFKDWFDSLEEISITAIVTDLLIEDSRLRLELEKKAIQEILSQRDLLLRVKQVLGNKSQKVKAEIEKESMNYKLKRRRMWVIKRWGKASIFLRWFLRSEFWREKIR